MLKLFAVLISLMFVPRTQVLTVKQTDKVLDTSVLLRVKQYSVDDKGLIRRGMSGCSGTYVAPDKILTAAHCFGNPTTDIWIRGKDGVSHPASLLKMDADIDLALLKTKHKSKKWAKVADETRVGEQVINVGSPMSFEFLVSEGIVSATKVWLRKYKARFVITTAMINPGSSGGAAFNHKGEILGVNTMSVGLFGWTGISIAVDAHGVKEFLDGSI